MFARVGTKSKGILLTNAIGREQCFSTEDLCISRARQIFYTGRRFSRWSKNVIILVFPGFNAYVLSGWYGYSFVTSLPEFTFIARDTGYRSTSGCLLYLGLWVKIVILVYKSWFILATDTLRPLFLQIFAQIFWTLASQHLISQTDSGPWMTDVHTYRSCLQARRDWCTAGPPR